MSIQIKNLTYIYGKDTSFEKKALDNINLTIDNNQFVGIIGHTGSGKSTLIQHLNALLIPTSGVILIDGEDINADKSTQKKVRQKVGIVFQYPEHQLFEMTVYKDVAFGPSNLNISDDEINSRVSEALQSVGLSENIYNKSPFELSGGQKRRVAIAGVLAMKPDILILDEPTAGLDPRGREEILSQIKYMHSNIGITVILVSHSMEDIAKLVQRIIVLNEGRVVLDGKPHEVFSNNEALENIGLAAPQISYVMKMLKSKGFDVSTDIFTVEAATQELINCLKRGKRND